MNSTSINSPEEDPAVTPTISLTHIERADIRERLARTKEEYRASLYDNGYDSSIEWVKTTAEFAEIELFANPETEWISVDINTGPTLGYWLTEGATDEASIDLTEPFGQGFRDGVHAAHRAACATSPA